MVLASMEAMSTVNTRGLVINGVILPDEPLHTHEGERVLITLLGSDNGTEDLARGDVDLSGRAPAPVDYIPPTESLAALLANAVNEQPIDAAAWNAQWAAIEGDMNKRDQVVSHQST